MLNETQIQNTNDLTEVFFVTADKCRNPSGEAVANRRPRSRRKVLLLDKTALGTFRIQRFKVRIRKVTTDN